jgi:hypothetical protein
MEKFFVVEFVVKKFLSVKQRTDGFYLLHRKEMRERVYVTIV